MFRSVLWFVISSMNTSFTNTINNDTLGDTIVALSILNFNRFNTFLHMGLFHEVFLELRNNFSVSIINTRLNFNFGFDCFNFDFKEVGKCTAVVYYGTL